ncbi:MAG: NAD-dependent malic enzyme [Verrucomicrobia bacterium Tous-C9LFEB]|nr:MAG: NAD-dependent malic enzyme [Verrucomicrobia bacterium Tous-C9LFEB]
MSTVVESTSISYAFCVRLTYANHIGAFVRIAQKISDAGGDLDAVVIVTSNRHTITRDVGIRARNEAHELEIVKALQQIEGVEIGDVHDRVVDLHRGGKISIQNKIPLDSRDALSLAYTPGVARVCEMVHANPARAYDLTIKGNSVAVVSDGTAVLGLGDIGPEAAMPVMEGKAMLFKEMADIDAYPICLNTKDPQQIIETVANLAPGFGGINLEDISAPRCFEIEEALKARLDIPVFHDDQHGTAVVTLAALYNAVKLRGGSIAALRIVMAGAGAAGVAICKILQSAGATDITLCDRKGAIHKGRTDLNDSKVWLAKNTNPHQRAGSLKEVMKGADVFIGVSGPGLIHAEDIDNMAARPLVFAMANPNPEIMPEEVVGKVFVMATGRSDYPNQINNVLAFPGIFRGALNRRAKQITEEMKVAAAKAIASCVSDSELNTEFIVPSVFNREVVKRVTAAVEACVKP